MMDDQAPLRLCKECQKPLEGRAGQKFCSPYCKSAYHYQVHRDTKTLFKRIDDQLKLNRKILKHFNKAGKSTLRKEVLHEAGFNPNYFTHYWKSQKGQVYLFCYEFGFLSLNEKGKDKYLLVLWQAYMSS